MDEIVEQISDELSMKQELGKLVIATFVGFMASKAAEKAFTKVVKVIRARKSA